MKTDESMCLGVTVDPKLNRKKHAANIISKTSGVGVGFIRRLFILTTLPIQN